MTDIRFVEKDHCNAVMNADLPPFEKGEHNSESESTNDRVITPLRLRTREGKVSPSRKR